MNHRKQRIYANISFDIFLNIDIVVLAMNAMANIISKKVKTNSFRILSLRHKRITIISCNIVQIMED